MKTKTETLPAHWASALINRDRSGLDTSPDNAAEFDQWTANNPDLTHPVACSDESYLGYWNGLRTEVLDYTYLVQFLAYTKEPRIGRKFYSGALQAGMPRVGALSVRASLRMLH